MSDQSHLDERYFVDEHVYNCPFCNRRHVSYSIYGTQSFDWTQNKECYVYFVRCHSCRNRSMHLSSYRILSSDRDEMYRNWRFKFSDDEGIPKLIDDFFFYSVPTSFFVLDRRIPEILRELLTEAEDCLKSNFLTGASACARKIVYEMTSTEKFDGSNYEDRIKSLKQKYPDVEQTYFDTLLTIQQVTSSKVHENSYDGWNSRHLRLILASLREMLHEIYVVPALREDKRKSILKLKEELLVKNVSSPKLGDDEADT